MHTYESWLYKNYQKPMTESDTNGLIVAFDPTRENALLHQQVSALQERTRFNRRVIAKVDTPTTLLAVAERAWQEGYEHLAVLADPNRISEVDRFLQERCGSAFESIVVVPESVPRLYEMVPGQAELMAGAQQQGQPQVQNAQNQKPFSLFFVQLNPPVKTTRQTLEAGMKILSTNKAPDPYFVFFDAGIDNKYVFSAGFRDKVLRGNDSSSIPAIYGKSGLNPIQFYGKIMEHSALHIGNQTVPDFISSEQILSGRQCHLIVIPERSRALMQFGELDAIVTSISPDMDSFAEAGHKALIDVGRKIAKDSPKKSDQGTSDFKKVTLEQKDFLTILFIDACLQSLTLQGDAFTKKITMSWGELSQGAKEFWAEAGDVTGIGDVVSGAKDIVKSVGSIKQGSKSEDPQNEGQRTQDALSTKLKNLEFDAMLAVNHAEYAGFQKALDLGD